MKILKYLGIILGVLVGALVIAYLIFNEPMPEGKTGAAADALAEKMLAAVNKTAWDSTKIVEWSFRSDHHYTWDKDRHWTVVRWEDYEIFINLHEVKGVAYKNGEKITGEAGEDLVYQAWMFWANDSFWFNAPVKAFDNGTTRKVVTLENGNEALLVTYSSGGVTPGDSYLWILDEQYRPKAWKLWVKIIPIGGIEFSWEDWTTTETGVTIAQNHHSEILDVPILNIKTGQTFEALGYQGDLFEGKLD